MIVSDIAVEDSSVKNLERPALSVVLPAYNESDTVQKVIERSLLVLEETTDAYELIVVDDGSIDDTYQKARTISAKNPRVKVVRNISNMGKGSAVKTAAEFTNGTAVVVLDADLEIDPAQLRQYVEVLKDYDMCIASKRHPESTYYAPPMRKFLSVSFNKLVRIMTGIRFVDSQTGFKAIRGEHFRTIMDTILVKRYAYDVEVLAVAQLMHLRIAELPVKINQNSRFSSKAVLYMFIDLLGISYRLRVLKWYQKRLRGGRKDYEPILRI